MPVDASHRFSNDLRRRSGDHIMQRQLTPPYVLEPVRAALGGSIGLDPCTEPDNPTGAARFYTVDDDGLAQVWWEPTIFVNPPYGEARGDWVKLAQGAALRGSRVIMLIPAHTRYAHLPVGHAVGDVDGADQGPSEVRSAAREPSSGGRVAPVRPYRMERRSARVRTPRAPRDADQPIECSVVWGRVVSVLRQASGAQVLPPVSDQRATISAYHASCALDADHRTKYPAFRVVASGLFPSIPGRSPEPGLATPPSDP